MSSFDMVEYLETNFKEFWRSVLVIDGKKITNIKAYHGMVSFVFNFVFNQFTAFFCVLPLVHVRFSSLFMIDIFNYLFAHFAQFRFAWVDKPACWFVPEVFFVISGCNERFSLGCYIYSITEIEPLCYLCILRCSLPHCSLI